MSSLNSLFIKKETLETLLKTVQAKGTKGVELTISINDKVNDYGQNLSAYVSQSKEDREAGKNKYYVGNGKCFWTDGSISVAPKQPESNSSTTSNSQTVESEPIDDLPF